MGEEEKSSKGGWRNEEGVGLQPSRKGGKRSGGNDVATFEGGEGGSPGWLTWLAGVSFCQS